MADEQEGCCGVQEDEIEALSSIYGDDFDIQDENDNSFEIRVCCEENDWWSLTLHVVMPQSYPENEPPIYEVFSECLRDVDLDRLDKELEEIWGEHKGDSVVYLWVERCREILCEVKTAAKQIEGDQKLAKQIHNDDELYEDLMQERSFTVEVEKDVIALEVETTNRKRGAKKEAILEIPEIVSGEPIIDRKSIFQAHVAQVLSEGQVKQVIVKLKENRKVARASHNIMAYRIEGSREGTFLQDNDDDGENEAGGRLMHLLRILDARNIVVVVSRWYGGILLGPDRFKHINNCARELIVNVGIFTKQVASGTHDSKGKKKGKGKSKKN
eukprot:Seg1646.9 transcript_id=Seg1646.9/GoldUCD/mRNA.D3Y31 product="Protein IMPACT" protein_id=Seg1646.9/GoldUCD/D3Y31